MEQGKEWVVVFYVEERGREPVREFLERLDLRTQARFAWSIEQLRIRNITAREPLVKHIRILILHGFQKKSQKTPRFEIELAKRRLTAFLQREGGE
jgi:hypothetical protein